MFTHILVGYSIFLSYWWDRERVKEQTREDDADELSEPIESLMANDVMLQAFTQFAIKELSVENVLCYLEIQQYKSKPSKETAVHIVTMYFESASPLEVNITLQHKYEVKVQMKTVEVYTKNLFDKVETAICENLMDTYKRFKSSQTYKTAMAERKVAT